jgi:hypothetical protein
MCATVQYVKILSEHLTTAETGAPGALAFVNDRLAGHPARRVLLRLDGGPTTRDDGAESP